MTTNAERLALIEADLATMADRVVALEVRDEALTRLLSRVGVTRADVEAERAKVKAERMARG